MNQKVSRVLRISMVLAIPLFANVQRTEASQTCALRLTLSANAKLVRKGAEIVCHLAIEGDSIGDIARETEGVVGPPLKDVFSNNGFRQSFKARASKPAILSLGPYSLNSCGKKLVSNKLELKVLEAYAGDAQVTVSFWPLVTRVGRSVEMLIEEWDAVLETKSPRPTQSPAFGLRSGPTKASFIFENGKTKLIRSSHYSFTPRRKGRFVFGARDLENLPAGMKIESQTLVAK